MSFNWLNNFNKSLQKPNDYAEKTLAQYRLGMKAKGSIVGVRLEIDPNCCKACSELISSEIFHPDEAPLLPPTDCERGNGCTCVYRPVMSYEVDV